MSARAHVVDASVAVLLRSAAAMHRAGDGTGALVRYLAVVERDPNCFDALHLIGVMALQRGKASEALTWLDRAIAVEPEIAAAHIHRGAALRELGRDADALIAVDTALRFEPDNVSALANRAAVLLDQGRAQEALDALDHALLFSPDHPIALYNRMSALRMLGRSRDALNACERAAQLLPQNIELMSHRAGLLRQAGRAGEALHIYESVLARQPADASLWCNYGHVLTELRRYDAALDAYRHAYALQPSIAYLPGWLMQAKLRVADWDGIATLQRTIEAGIDECRPVCEPFTSLLLPLNRSRLRRCAEIHTQRLSAAVVKPLVAKQNDPAARIRVGYFSADFYNHPTAQLVAGVIGEHDRSRFEIIGFSLGAAREDAMRERLRGDFDRFVDLHDCDDLEAVRIARSMQLDIAIDLGGYTRACRSSIFVNRVAPAQIAWLGFAGTLGAHHMDYMIADETVVPPEHEPDYAEEVLRLPNSYQPNDALRHIDAQTPTREQVGLPTDAFVFCCFNAVTKLTPQVFDVWMRLLRRVPGSVLWLLDANPTATARLKQHALSQGIDPARLVFAAHAPNAAHLARHRLADLFLDTWPYNAHTTASDALWAGLPLLTLQGETFPSRVAASLLRAVDLPELIVESVDGYEATAVELAMRPERVRELREKLAERRMSSRLFDTARFTRDLESVFSTLRDEGLYI